MTRELLAVSFHLEIMQFTNSDIGYNWTANIQGMRYGG